MLAARDQENLAFSHQHGAAIKQQQGQASRQLAPKTPGARYAKTPIKVPLNDENGAHTIKGAKNVNENAMTSKAAKGANRSNFVTPMAQRARAVLGDKTTNARTKGLQTGNGKGAAGDIDKSQAKPQNTVRSKQREAQAELQKLQIHVQESDSLSEDEVEYCPPKPKDLPYESDVFPDGVLNFDALKPENRLKGYHQYYFNPIDENGVSQRDRQLAEETKRAIEEGKKQIKEDLDSFDWVVKEDLEPDTKKVVKKASSTMKQQPVPRQPLSTVRSKNAAKILSMNDTTRSMQRKLAKSSDFGKPLHKQPLSFAMPTFRARKTAAAQRSLPPKKSAAKLEATSRTTIGYNRGRATASLLAKAKANSAARLRKDASASPSTQKDTVPRSNTTRSTDSDKTITPASFADKKVLSASAAAAAAAAAEDEEWRERVPFLSLFTADSGKENEDEDDILGIKKKMPDFLDEEEGEDFELKLVD
ncbi:hypothetical protein GGS21DRAFT_495834 [Xylaria nigripes]|nr:hypothetical protein GGS21DRAFT_495834 [Xylaria nigripes]